MTQAGIKHISAPDLARMLDEDPSLFVMDVREPFELISYGAIQGVRNIPMGELPRRIGELPSDTSSPIVIVCHSGSRSAVIAHLLGMQGHDRVFNLSGGMIAWIKNGFPLSGDRSTR